MKKCPQCGYSRTADDLSPDDKCPHCGVLYDSFLSDQEEELETATTKSQPEEVIAEIKQLGVVGVIKKIFFAIVMVHLVIIAVAFSMPLFGDIYLYLHNFQFPEKDDTSTPPPQPLVQFTILKDTYRKDIKIKRVVNVLLPQRVSKETLVKIAHKIKRSETKKAYRTFISYFIEECSRDNGYWAATQYTPDLEVSFYGLSKEGEDFLTNSNLSLPGNNVLGLWLDTCHQSYAARITYYEREGKRFLENMYSDGSRKTREVQEQLLVKGKRLEEIGGGTNSHAQHYIINDNGALEFWIENIHDYTVKRIERRE